MYLEEHLLKESLDAGTYLDELLGADTAYIVAVDLHVGCLYGLDLDYGVDGLWRRRLQKPVETACNYHCDNDDDDPRTAGKTTDTASCSLSEMYRATAGLDRAVFDFLS